MKLYVYVFKRPDLKRFEIFKNIPFNYRPQFSDFFSKISAILLSTDSHIKCIVCICVSFLYICLTSETLHYPWIPSCYFSLSRCPTRKQNRDYAIYLLNVLYHESWVGILTKLTLFILDSSISFKLFFVEVQ